MRVTRVFTGPDQRSHFEPLEVPGAVDTGRGLDTDAIPNLGVILRDRRDVAPMDMGFHNAPRRQLVVPLDGTLEVEVGSGEARTFGPGDVLLADDLTGQGHRTRSGAGLAHLLFVVLPADLDLSPWRG